MQSWLLWVEIVGNAHILHRNNIVCELRLSLYSSCQEKKNRDVFLGITHAFISCVFAGQHFFLNIVSNVFLGYD